MLGTSLTQHFLVAPQIDAEDIQELAEAGIRGLINNRPDGEAAGQPTSASLAAAASRAGMTYRHLPVVVGYSYVRRLSQSRRKIVTIGGGVCAEITLTPDNFPLSGTRILMLNAAAIT